MAFLIVIPMLLALLIPMTALAGQAVLTAQDIENALEQTETDLAALVKNASIEPQWMEDGHRFWYRRATNDGRSIVVVDARDGEMASFAEDEFHRAYDISPGADASASPELLPGPDRKTALFVRDHNLWIRDLVDGAEEALTENGAKHFAYASPLDQQTLHSRPTVPGEATRPVSTHWSPDGRWIITRQVDERRVQSYPFFQAVPPDGGFRPQVREVRVTLLGDPDQAVVRDVIIDRETGSSYPISLPGDFDLNDAYPANAPLGWSNDGRKAHLYASTIDAKTGRLLEVDLETGESRTVIEEHAPGSRVNISLTFGREPLVHVLGDEVVWYSERSGYGHLYMYDAVTGELKRQLTHGKRIVASILHVDTKRRSLLVSMGRDGDADPYELYVYRVSLDGGEPILITPEPAHHVVPPGGVSPGGDYIVDSYSTVSSPPKSTVRHVWGNGDSVLLEKADVKALADAGWQPPRRVRVKAADDSTDLYAAIFKPYGPVTKEAAHPIIDFNYINSIASITPLGYMDAFGIFHVESLRHLGFYVIVVDGRGTPNRSRSFREAGYPVFYDVQVEDHVAAIEQLAEQFSGMDIERVGIWGSSNGGAGAVRAILQRPDFFKTAVSSAGSHDYMSLPPSGIKFFGVPVYDDGSATRPDPAAIPKNYVGFDNAALADNLQGHLLLAYGDVDNFALPATTHRLVSALVKAGKTFDVLPMHNHGHFFLYEPYFKRRLVEYFVEHLREERVETQ